MIEHRSIPGTLLVVNDLEESIQFYVKVLGLVEVERHSDSAVLMVNQHKVYLFEGTDAAQEYRHAEQANSTLVFNVKSLDTALSWLKSHHVNIVHDDVSENRWGRYIGFVDPSGIIHEIFESNQ